MGEVEPELSEAILAAYRGLERPEAIALVGAPWSRLAPCLVEPVFVDHLEKLVVVAIVDMNADEHWTMASLAIRPRTT